MNSISSHISITDYTIEFLEKSSKWLRDPEIKLLIDAPEFSDTDQRNWFESLNQQKDQLIWGIKYQSERIGAFGFKKITQNDAEYWGYIGEKSFWGKGIGKHILDIAVGKAEQLGIKEIWLKVTKENERAINLYIKFGFNNYRDSEKFLYMKKVLTE